MYKPDISDQLVFRVVLKKIDRFIDTRYARH